MFTQPANYEYNGLTAVDRDLTQALNRPGIVILRFRHEDRSGELICLSRGDRCWIDKYHVFAEAFIGVADYIEWADPFEELIRIAKDMLEEYGDEADNED
jgi:hypothetical protein